MDIPREYYLNKLMKAKANGNCKILSGVKFCGKTYLLCHIFAGKLCENGIRNSRILSYELANWECRNFRTATELLRDIRQKMTSPEMYYILLDDLSLCDHPFAVLSVLSQLKNADVYVTTSSAGFPSAEMLRTFPGIDYIQLFPLSFHEYHRAYRGLKEEAWHNYMLYGGLPFVLNQPAATGKADRLISLLESLLVPEFVTRYRIRNNKELIGILHTLASTSGTPTNALQLAGSFTQSGETSISSATFGKQVRRLEDAFLISHAMRYDIHKKNDIRTGSKYYFTDHGLLNAAMHFQNLKEASILETILYNELILRGYQIKTSIYDYYGKDTRMKTYRERRMIDFMVEKDSQRRYIQLDFSGDSAIRSMKYQTLVSIHDCFEKIILTKKDAPPRRDSAGILTMGIRNFLLSGNQHSI